MIEALISQRHADLGLDTLGSSTLRQMIIGAKDSAVHRIVGIKDTLAGLNSRYYKRAAYAIVALALSAALVAGVAACGGTNEADWYDPNATKQVLFDPNGDPNQFYVQGNPNDVPLLPF